MIDTLLFTSWLKVLLPATHRQGHVCGSEEMHEHVNRRGAAAKFVSSLHLMTSKGSNSYLNLKMIIRIASLNNRSRRSMFEAGFG